LPPPARNDSLRAMFIRKTQVKSGPHGEVYYTYRIAESVRTDAGVKQRTLLNLGRHFPIEAEHWPYLIQRIEQLVQSRCDQPQQSSLIDLSDELNNELECAAQRYAALIIEQLAQPVEAGADSASSGSGAGGADYAHVDVNSVEALRPRSIGVEALGHYAADQLGLEQKLAELGFNGPHRATAIATLIARMAAPASELATHQWLQNASGLSELLGHDFAATRLWRLYQVSDDLLKHKRALEAHLYRRERDLFDLAPTIVLYDLTNTYFEGQASANDAARRGHSKDKRGDCPLVTLGLVLDGEGLPMASEVLPGNASEPATLAPMVGALAGQHGGGGDQAPVVVVDAGIATQANIDWLASEGYSYLVVSRGRGQHWPEQGTPEVVHDADDNQVVVQRQACPDTGETLLYCHSEGKQQKEQAIQDRLTARFEGQLDKIRTGLHKKGTTKRYDKVIERVGRAKEQYARAAQHYAIEVIADENKHKAIDIRWQRHSENAPQPGHYCLRTNLKAWSDHQLWHTYIMLTEVESAFRSMKTELGLRPVYHQKRDRVAGHLFITVLAFHLVQTLRLQLKRQGIHWSWPTIREIMRTQQRVTVAMNARSGERIFVRTTTRAEPRQQAIYDSLGLASQPGSKKQTKTDQNGRL